jgi:5-methylcytosine-specific restriction protein A
VRRDRIAAAAAWHNWYGLKAWKARRAAQLFEHPTCRMCEATGRLVSANVADHVIPHKGDEVLFWHGELQSLCQPCHDAGKARQERGGWDSACDLDGWPIDPNHPSNAVRS